MKSIDGYEFREMGVTPDGKWAWYAIRKWVGPDNVILGMVAESPEIKYWSSEETKRDYRCIFYEPSMRGEGSIAMTSFRNLDDALNFMVSNWQRHESYLEKVNSEV